MHAGKQPPGGCVFCAIRNNFTIEVFLFMDFRQLEAFCAIIEWGSFSEAAKKLYITQPTISNHMRMLETELNTILISRTTKTMTVTKDGRRFYKYARGMLDMRDKAVSDFSRSGSRRIHMGASSVPSGFILPEIMAEYKKMHPDAYFEIIQSDSIDIISNMKSEIIDAALAGTPCQDEAFECIPVFRDEMVLVTPDNEHYRALRDAARITPGSAGDGGFISDNCAVDGIEYGIDITELLLQPFILRKNGSATRREILNYLSSIGMSESQLNITSQMNDMKSVIASIACGLGVSILTRSITKTLPHGSVLTFPLGRDGDPVYRTYYLIYRKDLTGGYIKDFIDFILEYSKK